MVRRTIERLAIALAVALMIMTTIATPARAQNRTTADQDDGTMRWDDGSFRAGEAVRLEPHLRFQTDMLLRDRSEPIDDRFDWPRHRVSIEGELFKRVEFQVERELEGETPWRDVYGDLTFNRALRVRAGRFKIPFSTEQTTGGFNLDFLERPAAVEAMSPDRDLGVMMHGRPVDLLEYEIAVFRHSDGFALPVDGRRLGLIAGRVAFAPVRDDKDGLTRDLEVGVAVTRSAVPEGPNGLVGHDANGDRFFEHMYVKGARTRFGLNGQWSASRLTLEGELLQVTDGKRGRKNTAVDVEARLAREIAFESQQIHDSAFADPVEPYSNEEFDAAVAELTTFGQKRSPFVTKQLEALR